jgi:iron complex outermembrane receptor protein
MTLTLRARLLATAIALAGGASPALAQEQAAQTPGSPIQEPPAEAAAPDIVVTGSIFRRTDAETPSPVTVLSSADLDKRGISTVQDAIQQLSANNGPALTNSFTANGAFAGGASAVSLRGLSTSSTLVLFDGLRAAYFPLADDGTRNFVDLNTIPDDIVDRIEVLKDGASSSYGADAIAGVVNIITKRKFTGISARAEAGISQDGVGANQRLTLTAGTGDLDEKGYNAYVSAFYVHSAMVYNRDLPAPFNSDDARGTCFEGVCGPNLVINGLNAAGLPGNFVPPSDFYIRALDANNAPVGRFQLLNPTRGCSYGSTYRLTAADLAANATNPTVLCQEDNSNRNGVVSPNVERFGGSARITAKIGDSAEAYALFNFQQSSTYFTGNPAVIRANAGPGIIYRRFSTVSNAAANAPGSGPLTLPVYVCAARVNCATATDRRLNPNNPLAAQGQAVLLSGRLGDTLTESATRSRVYRAALGINGTMFDNWTYNIDATAMHNDLRRTTNGFVYIQHLLDVIADGSYNFVNPELNSQAVRDYLSPEGIADSSSDLYQAQAVIGTAVTELPGGPLQLGLGVAIRYEAIDAPSGNGDYNGPTQRFFTLNAFGTTGTRKVYSAFGELNAPILDELEANLSGRYDKYSSGQSAFSPKIGVKFTPFKQLAIRGTYSKGFRIPSFAEANALPTTGFVPFSIAGAPDSFLAQYGCSQATPNACPAYLSGAAVGQTTLATPDLKPEKSRSFTFGTVFEPIRNLTFTVDYFNIKKTGAITTQPYQPAITAYLLGQPIPDGYSVIADAPDPFHPLARPRIAFVSTNLVNSDTIKSEGIDFSATYSHRFSDAVKFSSSVEASYIINLSTTFADGRTESYEGTLGNFVLTAGSGTPEWRGSWQNTLQVDPFTISATANYVSGYNLSAEDQGGVSGDCGLSNGFTPCDVGRYITVDAVGSVRVNDNFTFYINVINLLNTLPSVDPVTYGALNYNPVQAGNGILGRQFRAGVKVNF